jgi:subtilisin family serine protease
MADHDPSGRPPRGDFDPESFVRTVIARPLAERLAEVGEDVPVPVVLELDVEYPDGLGGAKERVHEVLEGIRPGEADYVIHWRKSEFSPQSQFLYGRLTGLEIRSLVARSDPTARAPVRRVWLDFAIGPLTNRSFATVKADAAARSFSAAGEGVVWAVMDSGVDATHRHFVKHRNLQLDPPLLHLDFTGEGGAVADPLADEFGHGTHVAGTIAGEQRSTSRSPIHAWAQHRDEQDEIAYRRSEIAAICGMAPRTKILSLKVLDEKGDGLASNLMAAIGYLQQLNAYGRELKVHGVNMSVGYRFDAEWYGCGHSPLCVDVDRLVRSGVVVVAAAGNSGYSRASGGGLALSINDPGNAERAITVGATHRDEPYRYGVSFFSSKGPTADGRLKPDLVAPGERILSCAAGAKRVRVEQALGNNRVCHYIEDSGTSMAAPHVSGVIAAFLSIRREFIGQPERVKQIFLDSASNLGRDRYLQGAGLVDLMRAIQSV